MRQAIVTSYFGPTNCRGARVQAKCAAKTIYVPWDYSLDPDQNHDLAAHILLSEMGWEGPLEGGHLPNGTYAFVIVNGGKS